MATPYNRLARGITAGFATLGLVLSIYSLYVEIKHEQDSSYKAMCDISEKMSCSKAFSSKYGKGFGIVEPLLGKDSPLNLPNPVLGVVFYIAHILIAIAPANNLLYALRLMASIICCVVCIYLAYILAYVLNDFCIVCISTYVINAVLLIISYIELLQYKPQKVKTR